MTYRQIDTELWTDPRVKALDVNARLLFMWSLTNPHTHPGGIYSAPLLYMAHETGLSGPAVDKALGRLAGLVEYDREREVIWVVNMAGYQCNSPAVWTSAAKHAAKLHGSPLIRSWAERYQGCNERVSGLLDTLPTPSREGLTGSVDPSISVPVPVPAPAPARKGAPLAVEAVFNYWVEATGRRSSTKLTAKRQRCVTDRLKGGHSVDDLTLAIRGCVASSFHGGANEAQMKYDDLTLICRDDEHVEQFQRIATGEAKGATSKQDANAQRIMAAITDGGLNGGGRIEGGKAPEQLEGGR